MLITDNRADFPDSSSDHRIYSTGVSLASHDPHSGSTGTLTALQVSNRRKCSILDLFLGLVPPVCRASDDTETDDNFSFVEDGG